MAITHSNFLTQIRNYTEVSSTVLSDSQIQEFIRNVELDIAGKVDYDDLRKYVRSFLEKRDTSFISEFNGAGAQGTPKYFANWDEFNIIVAPTPAAADIIQINYIKDPPEFTSTNQTYLAKYQESMLLHGVLTECFRFLKGPMDMYKLYESKYNEEVQNFALQQMGRRRRAEYDDGVPRIQVPSPTPNTN